MDDAQATNVAEDQAVIPEKILSGPREKPEAIYQPLQDDVYHNMTMVDPNGKVLCRCGPKKVNWYLSRGLAKIICEEPLTIQLNFQPGGQGEHGDAYQLAEKHNSCVVCGRDDYNTKHHIVEYEYRQHMPLEYKSHNSYDLMILCGPCHTRYEVEAMKLKAEISVKYNAPMNGVGWHHDKEKGRAKKTAHALLVASDKMPPARILECRTLLAEYFHLEDASKVTDNHVQMAMDIDPVIRTEEFKTHGELVVSRLTSQELLTDFIHMWRKHFLETMQPQHIHELWEVDRGKSELRSHEKRPQSGTSTPSEPSAETPS